MSFDHSRYKWREVKGEPGLSYKVRHDYTILDYDVEAKTLDMIVRWSGDGGHCPLHRHLCTTTVLVLEGEQHLFDILPDGSRGAEKVRYAGDHALSTGPDQVPHLERGGSEGGVAFFGMHSDDGVFYEILDDDLGLLAEVTLEGLVEDFNANT